MIRFFANANYDFIGLRRYAYGITGVLFALTLVALAGWGLNYSIEFTGGTLLQVRAQPGTDVAAMRSGLDAQGIHGAEIQAYGVPGDFIAQAVQGDVDGARQMLLPELGLGAHIDDERAFAQPFTGGGGLHVVQALKEHKGNDDQREDDPDEFWGGEA